VAQVVAEKKNKNILNILYTLQSILTKIENDYQNNKDIKCQ